VVVGSAMVSKIEKPENSPDLVRRVGQFADRWSSLPVNGYLNG
jgi:hypothetical protein